MCDDDKIAFGAVDEHNPGDFKGIEELRQENDKLKKENEVCCLGKDKCQMSSNQIHSHSLVLQELQQILANSKENILLLKPNKQI